MFVFSSKFSCKKNIQIVHFDAIFFKKTQKWKSQRCGFGILQKAVHSIMIFNAKLQYFHDKKVGLYK